MSVVGVESTNGEDLSNAEARAAAQQAWRQAAAAGEPLTGVDLGRMFGRTDRWGRKQIERARHPVDNPTETPAPLPRNNTPPAGTVSDVGTNGNAARPIARPEPMWSRRLIRWVTTAAVIVVAACAARSSYDHQRLVVEMAGNHKAAWYLPLSVDGMMLIASLNMLVKRWDGEAAGSLTSTALLLGGVASLAANIAAAPPTWIGRLVAAWSPICLIVSYELLMQQLPHKPSPTVAENGDTSQLA